MKTAEARILGDNCEYCNYRNKFVKYAPGKYVVIPPNHQRIYVFEPFGTICHVHGRPIRLLDDLTARHAVTRPTTGECVCEVLTHSLVEAICRFDSGALRARPYT